MNNTLSSINNINGDETDDDDDDFKIMDFLLSPFNLFSNHHLKRNQQHNERLLKNKMFNLIEIDENNIFENEKQNNYNEQQQQRQQKFDNNNNNNKRKFSFFPEKLFDRRRASLPIIKVCLFDNMRTWLHA